MLRYNTELPRLVLPEYGRNVQQMVDYCCTISDRDERTSCAYTIVAIMSNLFPELLGENGDDHKFWDHINVMADFNLDIDFPCDVIQKENLNPKPEKIPYSTGKFRFRHYGRDIEMMVKRVAELEDGAEKDALISMVANHMKKLMVQHNPEGVDDARILADLADYSGGRINLDAQYYRLHEYQQDPSQAPNKKKKKK